MTELDCNFSFLDLQKRLENQPFFCFEGQLSEQEVQSLIKIIDSWTEQDMRPTKEALLVEHNFEASVEFIRSLLKEDLFLAYQNAIDGFDQALVKQLLLDELLYRVGVKDLALSIGPQETQAVLQKSALNRAAA